MQSFMRRHPLLFWSGTGMLAFFLILATALYAYVQYRYSLLPSVESLQNIRVEEPLRIYTHDGVLLGEFGAVRRTPISFEHIPQDIIHAFLSAEDDDFYHHSGIDFAGMLRSVYVNLRQNNASQRASTITMQLARNYYLTNIKTWRRKRDEIILAWKIENTFSKDDILELYLNKIYFGHRAHGIAAAAQVYYGKPVNQLTLPQIAMIAGLPKAPSRYNPIVNPKRAVLRRNDVLRRMNELGYIPHQAYQEALNTEDNAELHNQKINVRAYYIAEMVRQEMRSRYGDAVNAKGYNVYTTIEQSMQEAANNAVRDGLLAYDQRHGYRGALEKIDLVSYPSEAQWEERISLYPRVNGMVPAVIVDVDDNFAIAYHPDHGRVVITAEGLEWATKTKGSDTVRPASQFLAKGDIVYMMRKSEAWWLAQVPQVEGAFVALSPEDGAIKALVGGFDYFKSKYNRVTQALRQPGSNFKPFIYSAALSKKEFTTATIINDAPIEDNGWRPQNSDYRFEGPIPMRRALVRSKNMVAIRLLQAIGIDYARDYAKRFGFDKQKLPDDLTLALGSAVVTPLQLARGFSVFANGGYAIDPYLIRRVEDSSGHVVWLSPSIERCDDCRTLVQADSDQDRRAITLIKAQANTHLSPRVINKQNAYLVTSMLRDVIAKPYGTGRRAQQLHRNDIAGKTGTTNDQKDAWFTGFNQKLVATAWVGFDQPQNLGRSEYGGRPALPIWMQFMQSALRNIPDQPPVLPEGMTMVRIDPDSGQRACSDSTKAVFEPFPTEKAPKECSKSDYDKSQHDDNDNPYTSS